MKIKFIMLMLLLSLPTVNSLAQEDTSSETQTPPPAQETALPQTAPSQVQPDEQFEPSETISEDLSVPFPVDI